MATRTDNLKLSKAETSDGIKSTLTANNQNFDKLDGVITRLKNNQLQGTASGTEIVIQDSAEMESVLELSGNSEQDSRTGNNKFDMVKGSLSNCTKVIDGNSITLTSTLSTGGFSAYSFTTPANPNTDYYIKCKSTRTGNGGGGIVIQAQRSDGTSSGNIFDKKNTLNAEGKITTTADTVFLKVYLYASGDSGTETEKVSATYTDVQLVEGSYTANTVPPFELYGLQPSPDFPSEIRSVKSKSDNLFDISKKKDNTVFTWSNGVENADAGDVLSDYILIEGIKTISSNYGFYIAYYDANKNYLGNSEDLRTTGGLKYKANCPIPSNAIYCRIRFFEGSRVNPTDMTTVTDIMLNKGTEALPYQPYGYVPVEVKVEGKNLIFLEDKKMTTNSGQFSCSIKEQSITLNGTAVAGNIFPILRNSDNDDVVINLTANQTYYFKMFVESGTASATGDDIQLRDKNGILFTKTTAQWITGFSYTPTTNINTTWVRMFFDNRTFTNYKFKLLISKENSSNWLEPKPLKLISLPLGDIELHSTPDGTRDTFEKINGVWNYKNNIGQIIVDGSKFESLGENTYYDSDNYKTFTIAYVRMQWKKAGCQGYSDKFKIITSSNYLALDQAHLFFGNISYNQIWVHLPKSEVPTLDDFKTWLPNNPIELVAPLATPTYTPVEDQGLISALDELEDLILHKGYNYITATGVNNVKAYLDLSYYKDINIVLDNINASILSLGGGASV